VKDIYNSRNKFGGGIGLNRENYILFICDIFWEKIYPEPCFDQGKVVYYYYFFDISTQEGDNKVVY
jgi:hypothetical protein